MPFSEAVTDSLKAAAAGLVWTYLCSTIAMTARPPCATRMSSCDNRVDLVIEFQIDQHVAPVVADKIDAAGIPLIAVDIPHPHATFFGVNNYRVGFEAGECLAHYAKRTWAGKVRWALGLDLDEASGKLHAKAAIVQNPDFLKRIRIGRDRGLVHTAGVHIPDTVKIILGTRYAHPVYRDRIISQEPALI
jgi:ABC-type sugar transport system substrate-binding protein